VTKWTRTFAAIPRSRRQPESFSWIQPGIVYDVEPVTREISSSTPFPTSQIITEAAHGFTSGDAVTIFYEIFDPNNPSTRHIRNVFRLIQSIDSTTAFTVALITDVGPLHAWLRVIKGLVIRAPRAKTVPSWLQFDYFLPRASVGVETPDDIDIFEQQTIFNNLGTETDSFSSTSTPTANDYRAQVAAQTLIVAETSIVRPWLGNIQERVTRYVRAI
jgi:hypothetical protein